MINSFIAYISCLRCCDLAQRIKSEEAAKNPFLKLEWENAQYEARKNVLAYVDGCYGTGLCLNCDFTNPAAAIGLSLLTKEEIKIFFPKENPQDTEKPHNYRTNAEPNDGKK